MTDGESRGTGKPAPVAGARPRPREMELDSLLQVLVGEHSAMKDGLSRAREQHQTRDFAALVETLKALDSLFRQHIVDEESTLLRLLIERVGRKGAEEEIRVFQQHAPIYELMKRVAGFASMSVPELKAAQDELEDLFESHAAAEELSVFPRVRSLSAERPSRTGS